MRMMDATSIVPVEDKYEDSVDEEWKYGQVSTIWKSGNLQTLFTEAGCTFPQCHNSNSALCAVDLVVLWVFSSLNDLDHQIFGPPCCILAIPSGTDVIFQLDLVVVELNDRFDSLHNDADSFALAVFE